MLDELAEKINSLQHKIDEKTIMEKAAEARLSNSRTTVRASRARATDDLPTAIPAPKINYQSQQTTAPEVQQQQITTTPVAPNIEDRPALASIDPDNQPVDQAAVGTFDNESTNRKISDFSAELKKALKGIDVSGTSIKLSAPDGSQPISKLQTEGVFGISSSEGIWGFAILFVISSSSTNSTTSRSLWTVFSRRRRTRFTTFSILPKFGSEQTVDEGGRGDQQLSQQQAQVNGSSVIH